MGLLGLCFAWCASAMQQERHRRYLSAKAEAVGGYVDYEDQTPQWRLDLRLIRNWFGQDTLASVERVQFFCDSDPKGTNDSLAVLHEFPDVPRVDLYGRSFSDDCIVHLRQAANLTELHLDQTAITSKGLSSLGSKNRLTQLFVSLPLDADELLGGLSGLQYLELLTLDNTNVTSAGLTILKSLPHLEDLYLKSARGADELGDDALSEIATVSSLKFLWIERSVRITDEGINQLCKLRKLQSLSLNLASSISPATARSIAALPDLENINLAGVVVGDDGFRELTRSRNLKKMSLRHANVTDVGACELGQLKGLTSLELSETPISDATLAVIGKLRNLDSLMLRGTAVTDAGLIHLKKLPNLKNLLLDGSRITDEGILHLQMLSQLDFVAVGSTVTAEGRARLEKSLPNCHVIP